MSSPADEIRKWLDKRGEMIAGYRSVTPSYHKALVIAVDALEREAEEMHSGYTRASPNCQCGPHEALAHMARVLRGES